LLLPPLPVLIWNIVWDPARVGEVIGELCVLDGGAPTVVAV